MKQFQKYSWLSLIPLVFIISYLLKKFKILKNSKKEPTSQEVQAILQDQSVQNLTQEQINDYNRIARDLTVHLGVSYSWYDPRFWTENDKEAYDLISHLSTVELLIVSIGYKAYSTRDLYVDLSKLLDSKYYKLLNNLQ